MYRSVTGRLLEPLSLESSGPLHKGWPMLLLDLLLLMPLKFEALD